MLYPVIIIIINTTAPMMYSMIFVCYIFTGNFSKNEKKNANKLNTRGGILKHFQGSN